MRVFVAGGTGAIGREAVVSLVAAAHDVTALARSAEKAAWLSARGARPVTLSLFDVAALARELRGHDAVVNLATALPPTHRFVLPWAWRENTRVRVEGSAALVAAALECGVPTVIQESVAMLYPDRGSDWIDEDVPTDRYPMAEANLAAEANARRFGTVGGDAIVLRFGWFYGPGATHSEEFHALARRHVCVSIGAPGSYVSSIHVADGGRAVAAALRAGAGTYNVVDDRPLTMGEYSEALEAAARTRAWIRPPGRLASLLGNRTTSLTRSLRVSNARFRDASGWSPAFPSAIEGWEQTARVLDER